jgi:hypothetical protein
VEPYGALQYGTLHNLMELYGGPLQNPLEPYVLCFMEPYSTEPCRALIGDLRSPTKPYLKPYGTLQRPTELYGAL